MGSNKVETDLIAIGEFAYFPDAWHDRDVQEAIVEKNNGVLSPFTFSFYVTADLRHTICTVARCGSMKKAGIMGNFTILMSTPVGVGMAIRRKGDWPGREGLRKAFERAIPWKRGVSTGTTTPFRGMELDPRGWAWNRYLRAEPRLLDAMSDVVEWEVDIVPSYVEHDQEVEDYGW